LLPVEFPAAAESAPGVAPAAHALVVQSGWILLSENPGWHHMYELCESPGITLEGRVEGIALVFWTAERPPGTQILF
jgi:hypothetical protein